MPLFQKFKDISISRKLYIVVGTMAVLIAAELFTLWFAIGTLSAVRSLVGAEGLYSKAQKDGIYQLAKYIRTHDEKDYEAYRRFMQVNLGDHKAQVELMKKEPDLEKIRQGFTEGRIHPNDLDRVISLLRRFHKEAHIAKAINLWIQGDSLIALLTPAGDSIHAEITSAQPSGEKLEMYLNRIESLNHRLTLLEDDFSYTLGEGSRWLENFILKLLFLVALTVEITGLTITILVSRSISKGLNEIISTTDKVSKGDMNARAIVFSGDEIGQVAMAVNEMTNRITNSNKELGQFAYIAAHDLQEPLRTINNYVSLFHEKYKGNLDENGDKYLDAIKNATDRMQLLIRDLLGYSQIGRDKALIRISCNELLAAVLEDMAATIKENEVTVHYKSLPVLQAYPDMRALFQNLISNAIKFRKKDSACSIFIRAEQKSNEWLFSVQDNGIGIEQQYHERIFVIFQKLHSRKEYAGTGIGLAHCRKIVELHGGRIWVESEPGKGSTFYFTIPKISGV